MFVYLIQWPQNRSDIGFVAAQFYHPLYFLFLSAFIYSWFFVVLISIIEAKLLEHFENAREKIILISDTSRWFSSQRLLFYFHFTSQSRQNVSDYLNFNAFICGQLDFNWKFPHVLLISVGFFFVLQYDVQLKITQAIFIALNEIVLEWNKKKTLALHFNLSFVLQCVDYFKQ